MDDLVAAKRTRFIGRQRQMRRLHSAILSCQTVLLEGDAGSGKTTLLHECKRRAEKLGFITPDIIDFYDSAMHSGKRLEEAIIAGLGRRKNEFSQYQANVRKYERGARQLGTTDEQRKQELRQEFLNAYSSVASSCQGILLRFDTAEVLEYEQDSFEVAQDCDVKLKNAPSWDWIQNRINNLPNTSVVIAARPTKERLLRETLTDARIIEVDGFSLKETEQYFRSNSIGRRWLAQSPDMVKRIHLLTGGRPILISLALDWLHKGYWESQYYEKDVEELEQLHSDARNERLERRSTGVPGKMQEVLAEFERTLVLRIDRLPPNLGRALRYASVARKGLTVDLLCHLFDTGKHEAPDLFDQLSQYSFVKSPLSSPKRLFFHDKMYDLFEEHIWAQEDPYYRIRADVDRRIDTWYQSRIDECTREIVGASVWRDRFAARAEQQILITEQLYYRFDADPVNGYRYFQQLDEEAIGSREREWDILLRNEALSFTANRAWRLVENGPTRRKNGLYERSPEVDYDCRRRWVNRYIAYDDKDKAIEVGDKLLHRKHELEEPKLYRTGLEIAVGTAEAYKGGKYTKQAIDHLTMGIVLAEQYLQQEEDSSDGRRLLPHYLLAVGHLSRGIACRDGLRLRDAANDYKQAKQHFKSINYKPGQAEALNNLAYILARQGKTDRAHLPCDEAIEIRISLGDEYPIGLSQNTRGIIYERENEPELAVNASTEALNRFTTILNDRGIMLAEINLGRSLRRKGRSIRWRDKDGFEIDFTSAETYLNDAIRRLEGTKEEFYSIEAYDERGCLYRDWVATLHEQGSSHDALGRTNETLLVSAEKDLLEAKRLVLQGGDESVTESNAFLLIDVLEDLARVYFWWARLDQQNAARLRQQALDFLGDATNAAELIQGLEEHPFLMGKIHHQHARIARESGDDTAAAQHYVWAAHLLERYSNRIPELDKTVKDACNWLKSLENSDQREALILLMRAQMEEGTDSPLLLSWIEEVV